MALQPFVEPWPLLQFRNPLYTNGRSPCAGNQPVASRYLYTGRNKHRINAYTDIHALSGIRNPIPAFELAKTVHALDRADTVIGPTLM
jgi:hypothetical protein